MRDISAFVISSRVLTASALFLCALPHSTSAELAIINDNALVRSFENKAEAFVNSKKETLVADLVKSLQTVSKKVAKEEQPKLAKTSPENRQESVFIISAVYDCGHCDRWHMGGVATAWALSSDGVMVTNHHVMANAKGEVMAVSDSKGNLWPVSKVLATNKAADLCIFKVKGDGFKPLALSKPAAIGTDVEVIAHPGKRFFTHTFGKVTRYFSRKSDNTNWMSISADFAKGSSGGPVINPKGEVVGMVSFTNTLAVPPVKENGIYRTQMVIKSCTPVSAIWETLSQKPE